MAEYDKKTASMGRAWLLFMDGTREYVPEGMIHATFLNAHPELEQRGPWAECRLYTDRQGSLVYAAWVVTRSLRWLSLLQDDLIETPAQKVYLPPVGSSPEIQMDRQTFLTARNFNSLTRVKIARRNEVIRAVARNPRFPGNG
jgi:hypothetical protein